MFESLFQKLREWGSATAGYAAHGLNAPVKFVLPSLPNFRTLTIHQRNTYDSIADNALKTHIQNGLEANAVIILDAINTHPELRHVWTVLQVNGLGAANFANFLTLSQAEIQTYLTIITGANDGSATATQPNRDVIKTTLSALPANELKQFMTDFGGNAAWLDAINTHPELRHVWTVLQVNGLGAANFANFLTLSQAEIQTYLTIITGANDGSATATQPNRAAIKTTLSAMPAAKVKAFLAEFQAAPSASFDALNATPALLGRWQNLAKVNSTTVPQNRKIEFLKAVEYLHSNVGGQATMHHIMQGDYVTNNTGGIKGIKGVHHISAVHQAVVGVDTAGDVRVSGAPIPLSNGFYQQQVEVYTWQGNWKAKTGNGGLASFFPDAWTQADVIEEIAFAEANAIYQENVDITINDNPYPPIPFVATFKCSGAISADTNNLSTANLISPNAGLTTISNTPFPTHPEGNTHNAKNVVVTNIAVDACNAVLITSNTGSISFLGSTYIGTTVSGNNCNFYLYNPNTPNKIIGSAFPV